MISWNDHTAKLYFGSTLLSICCLLFGIKSAHYLFNALIIPCLLFGLFQKFRKEDRTFSPLLLIALFFGFIGDMLSMIKEDEVFFKSIALSSFTVGQFIYFLILKQHTNLKTYLEIPIRKRLPEAISLIAMYAGVYLVMPNLEDLTIQTFLYTGIGYLTFLTALNRRFFVEPTSFRLVILGLLLFWISDLLYGFDLWMQNSLISSSSILSFTLGNFILVNGILLQSESDNKKKEAPQRDASINKFRFQ